MNGNDVNETELDSDSSYLLGAQQNPDFNLKSQGLKELLSNYKMGREIGRGAQKCVYLATDVGGKSLAVKIGRYKSRSALERVEREVNLLTVLDAPGVGKILEFHKDPSTREFVIVEPFHDARPLSECSALFMDLKRLEKFMLACYVTLAPIWELRIVHRDLKPHNILVTSNFNPVIIDFGIARFLDHSSITDSSAGHGPCTPAYAAREQLTNRKVDIDSRTDYFALGVIASELICGEHPFSPEANENDDDIVENIISGTYRIRDKRNVLSAAFREFLEKSLQPEPFQRFRTSLEAMKLLIGN